MSISLPGASTARATLTPPCRPKNIMSRTIKLVTLILCLASPLATAQTIVLENEFARATFDPDPMSPYGWHLASIEQLDGTAPVGSSVWPAGNCRVTPTWSWPPEAATLSG